MKKRRLVSYVLITFLLATVMMCGTVIAYMFKKTEYMDNRFTPAQVTCEVEEVFDSGTNQKTSIKVKNTGNIDAYLRVRLVSYWVKVTESGDYEITAKVSVVPVIEPTNGWLKGSYNTYYFQSPVAPGASTANLLPSEIELEKVVDTDGSVYLQVIEVFAEAIQSKPVNAVTSAWKVTLNDSGNITGVQ